MVKNVRGTIRVATQPGRGMRFQLHLPLTLSVLRTLLELPLLPAIDTVIVHRRAVTDEYAVQRNLGKTKFEPTRVLNPDFLKLADMVVAAKAS